MFNCSEESKRLFVESGLLGWRQEIASRGDQIFTRRRQRHVATISRAGQQHRFSGADGGVVRSPPSTGKRSSRPGGNATRSTEWIALNSRRGSWPFLRVVLDFDHDTALFCRAAHDLARAHVLPEVLALLRMIRPTRGGLECDLRSYLRASCTDNRADARTCRRKRHHKHFLTT